MPLKLLFSWINVDNIDYIKKHNLFNKVDEIVFKVS